MINERVMVNFIMDKEDYKKIKTHLDKEGITISGLLRSILKQILEDIEKTKNQEEEHKNKIIQGNEKHYEYKKE